MKLVEEFDGFMEKHVDLNPDRIEKLRARVGTIQKFVAGSDWKPRIKRFTPQGSWAHKTIIKPPGTRGFDADLMAVVDPVEGWPAQEYVLDLRRVFRASGVYREMCALNNRCVTVSYANDFDIDVVPCVDSRLFGSTRFEVCNRNQNDFEPTASEDYTAWLDQRNEWVGADRLRQVIRLLKYLRDIKYTFSCRSILFTTLLGRLITAADAGAGRIGFVDLPTALRTLVGRLDEYLQARPALRDVVNPVLPEETFNRHWDQDKYSNFREKMQGYRQRIEDAYLEPDEGRSRGKWQEIFGDQFGRNQLASAERIQDAKLPVLAHHGGFRDIVDAVKSAGMTILAGVPNRLPWVKPAMWRMAEPLGRILIHATAHEDRSGTRPIQRVQSGQVVRPRLQLKFEAQSLTGVLLAAKDLRVLWQVVNSDGDAWKANSLRGGFYESDTRGVRWETTQYRGVHWVQAFAVRKGDRVCVARSERFFVVIE